jgi:hypothetical protein
MFGYGAGGLWCCCGIYSHITYGTVVM